MRKEEKIMNYADIKIADVANGKGVRVSLFVSGCNHHCKGCFNAQAWDFNYGKEFTEKEIDKILEDLDHPYVSGLSLLGGEPLEYSNCKYPELIYPSWPLVVLTLVQAELDVSSTVTDVPLLNNVTLE